MLSRCSLVAVLCVGMGLVLAQESVAEPVEFVVLGDMPYSDDEVDSLGFIGRKIRASAFPFVIHYGDVKAGRAPCDDSLLSDRKTVIYGLLKDRVFYTPGDNDWTDCDREGAGEYDELERLDKLRSIFFADGMPSNPEWHIARQGPDYPENARWEYGGLQFVTLHIVGTDNGRQQILKSDVETALDKVDARDRANLTWLDAAFDQAQQRKLNGLVVAIHADPGELADRDNRNRPCTTDEPTACNPYLTFLRRLTERADAFDKPVLLVHGSTNSFCFDRSFGGWQAPNLSRLNGPGDFVVIDAAVVSFEAGDREPFKVRGLLSNDFVPRCALP